MKYTCIVSTLVAATIMTTAAQMPGGKCSMTGYLTALASCGSQLAVDLVNALNRRDQWKQVLTHSCNHGLFDKTIECVEAVNVMCDYSYFSVDVLQVWKRAVCGNNFYTVIGDVTKCAWDSNVLIPCFKYSDVDQNNIVCSTLKMAGKCLANTLKCPTHTSLQDLLTQTIEALRQHECNGGDCSLFPYLGSIGGCYSKYIVTLITKLRTTKFERINIKTMLCEIPEVEYAFQCHISVDTKCKWSLINGEKVKQSYEHVCAVKTEDLAEIGKCVRPGANEILACFNSNIGAVINPCEAMNNVKPCFLSLFVNCPKSVSNMFAKVYDVVKPNSCTDKNSLTKCTTIEYVGVFGLCWYSSVLGVMSLMGFRGIEGRCSRSVTFSGASCQRKLDDMCDTSLVNCAAARKLMNVFCDDNQVIPKAQRCITSNGAAFEKIKHCDKLELLSKSFTSNGDVCRHSNGIFGCFLNIVSKKCESNVYKMFSSAIKTIKPKECNTALGFSSKATYIVMVIPFFVILVT